jgi:NADP-dependent 3-hydroxy acid dehydrogenase YdfG
MGALEGTSYLVTGAGAIGVPIARAFAKAGAKVTLADVRPGSAMEVAKELGGLGLVADLMSIEGAEAMVRDSLDRWGRIDGVVHTVGGFGMAAVEASDAALYDRMFDANMRTLFHVTRAVVPRLRAQNSGFIAAFSSEPAWRGAAAGAALYAAAKAAATAFLRSLDAELAGTGVKVTILYPMGAVDTAANRKAMPDGDPAGWIDPEEIAASLVFAASRSPRGRLTELPIFSGTRA